VVNNPGYATGVGLALHGFKETPGGAAPKAGGHQKTGGHGGEEGESLVGLLQDFSEEVKAMFYIDESNGVFGKAEVVGIGGGGCNAINNMVEANLQGVEFHRGQHGHPVAEHEQGDDEDPGRHQADEGTGRGANPEVGRRRPSRRRADRRSPERG